jgi:hypothetical protein
MRKLLTLALAGAAFAGAGLATAAQAQPYGAYPPGYYGPAYRDPGYRDYDHRRTDDYYRRDYYGDDSVAGLAGALLGSAMRVPYDRYGADPNGMIARDGHRIKCKLTDGYDSRYGRYMTHRVCW